MNDPQKKGFKEMPVPQGARSFLLGARCFVKDDLSVIVSDDDQYEEPGYWRHVSFSHPDHMPTYDETLLIRDTFFPGHAYVVQIFPPRHLHVNNHPYCLHLWWNKSDAKPYPEAMWAAVGIPGVTLRR